MAKFCIKCGTALREGAKFCSGCGAKIGFTSALPPNAGAVQKPNATAENLSVKQGVSTTTEDAGSTQAQTGTVTKEAAHLANKALSALLEQTIGASDKAGEMRISMTDAQKSLLTTVIRELGKRIGK